MGGGHLKSHFNSRKSNPGRDKKKETPLILHTKLRDRAHKSLRPK